MLLTHGSLQVRVYLRTPSAVVAQTQHIFKTIDSHSAKNVPSLVSQPLDKDHPHKSVLLPRLTNAELIVLSKTFDHKLAKLKVSHQTFHGTNARRWKPASNERRQKCLTQLLTKLSEDDSAVATDMDEDQMSSREYVCDDWCADQDEDLEADANAFAQGAKNAYLRHFVLKMHHFIKTGSGQT
jgi:hypothetical protein